MKVPKVIPLITVILCMAIQNGCLEEGTDGCPADMMIAFYVDDRYQESTFDALIENDVMLYIFKNKKCITSTKIPYDDIKEGQYHAIRKTSEISGDLDLVAWAVPQGDSENIIPQWHKEDNLQSLVLRLDNLTEDNTMSQPVTRELFLGTVETRETIDTPSHHNIGMIYSYCRIEVNVTDTGHTLANTTTKVELKGAMSQMNMQLQGTGSEVVIEAPLQPAAGDNTHYTTGIFGVLPSQEGQTVSVDIIHGDNLLATLAVPRENMPKGAEAGEFLIFEYTIGASFFTIVIDGYRINLSVVTA